MVDGPRDEAVPGRAAGAPPTAAEAGAATRERLTAAALTVFASRGYRCGSINDIAALAGVTRQGLLHHHPTKEALLLALLERIDADADAEADAEAVAPAGDPLRLAMAVPDPSGRGRSLVQFRHVLAAEVSGDEAHPAREWVVRRRERAVAALARAVEEAVRAGAVAAGTDPLAAATVLLALREGLETLWLADPSSVSPEGLVDALAGLVPGGPPAGPVFDS
ncbi:hypothetical protein NUM3379_23810 [Kineococcus sp. NUM-3379]